jgi:hypothetical protein
MGWRNRNLFAPCGAWARSAQRPCIRRPVLAPDGRPRNGRCPSHGGLSVKPARPKTPAGAAAIAAGQRRRWARYHADRQAGRPYMGRPLGRPPKRAGAKVNVQPPRPKPPVRKIVLTEEEKAFGRKIGLLK